MTPFAILFVVHYVQDWIFQDKKTACGKLTNQWTRLNHCCWYAWPMSIAFALMYFHTGFTNLSDCLVVWWISHVYFVSTHFIIDTPAVKKWICRYTRRQEDVPDWYYIRLDEIMHVVTLVLPALILSGIVI